MHRFPLSHIATHFLPQKKVDSQKILNSWSRRVVAYEIYVRSFFDSNNDGIGDLQGIIEKLDYLNDGTSKSLGVGAIWLTPFYKSPMADFGYDITNHCEVDPIFGDLETFDKLVSEAHMRGIKIMIDFVSNHTSEKHPWFKESKSSKHNPKRDWYIWKPGRHGGPPNNWESLFGGSAWEYDKDTGEYYLHSFLKQQPDVNWRNPAVQQAFLRILDFWLSRGVDGIRLDAINHIIKDARFLDEPHNPNYSPNSGLKAWYKMLHPYMRNQPETLKITNLFSEFTERYGDKLLVGEANLGISEMVNWHRATPNKRFSPLNFIAIKLPWQAHEYKKFIDEYDGSLDYLDLPNYFLSNHDRHRLASRNGQHSARVAAMMILTLRGLPFIYYGDELGMEDVEIPQDQVVDNFGKNEPGQSRDPERTPMPWDDSQNGGFSKTKPWLPLENLEINVTSQSKNMSSVLNLYKKLIHLRNNSKAINLI